MKHYLIRPLAIAPFPMNLLPLVALLYSLAPSLSAQAQRLSNLEVEVITLTHQGFHPSILIRKPGTFRLVLSNISSSSRTSDFDIVDDRGAARKTISLDLDKVRHASDQIELPPGTYALRLRSQPSISLSITIDPNRK